MFPAASAAPHIFGYVCIALAAVAVTLLVSRGRAPVSTPGRPQLGIVSPSPSPYANLFLSHLQELAHQAGHSAVDGLVKKLVPGLAPMIEPQAEAVVDSLEAKLYARLVAKLGLPAAPDATPTPTVPPAAH